ncbi:MAG TPA: AI-2E family transporter [Alphaproteobacteria bacterium]|nr:AI-2E family transporter [Alphaproteobacteria bacterium]
MEETPPPPAPQPMTAPRATTASVLRQLMLAAAILVALALVGRALLILFAAILISIGIRTMADAVQKRLRWRRSVALTVVLLIGVTALGGAIWLSGASLAAEIDQLTRLLPESLGRVTAWLGHYGWGRYVTGHAQSIVEDQTGRLIGLGSTAASGLIGGLGELLIAALMGIYLAIEPDLYRRGLIRLCPAGRRPQAEAVLTHAEAVLAGWIKAQAAAMALIGVSTGIGLALIGIPSAPLLGLITGLVNFIPNLGPIIAGVPTLLMAIPEGGTAFLMTLALITVVQIVEGYLITPLLEQRIIALPPALTLVAQLCLGALAGGLGFALAAPLAAVAITLVRELYILPIADKA